MCYSSHLMIFILTFHEQFKMECYFLLSLIYINFHFLELYNFFLS